MTFVQRNRRVLRLVTTAMATKAVTSTVAAAKVRLAISISNSRASSKRDNKFARGLTDQLFTSDGRGPRVLTGHLPSTIKSISTTTINPNPVIGFSLNSLLFGQRGRLPSSATIKRKAKTTVSIPIALGPRRHLRYVTQISYSADIT